MPQEGVERVAEAITWALIKVRYARGVIRESKGERPEEVLRALREVAGDE